MIDYEDAWSELYDLIIRSGGTYIKASQIADIMRDLEDDFDIL